MAALDFYVSARLITVQFSKIKSSLVALAPHCCGDRHYISTCFQSQALFSYGHFIFKHLSFKVWAAINVVLFVVAGRHLNIFSDEVAN